MHTCSRYSRSKWNRKITGRRCRNVREWSSLVAAVEGSLRLYRHKDGALVTLADYLHRRTRGMIGSLLWLLRDASCQAILDGTEKITRKSLDQIAIDMTAQAPPPRTAPRR
jgi:hypothetical protein